MPICLLLPRFSGRGQLNYVPTEEKIKERKKEIYCRVGYHSDLLPWHASYAKRKLIVAFMEQARQDIESHIGDDQAGHDFKHNTVAYFSLSVAMRACLLQFEGELLGRRGGMLRAASWALWAGGAL
jgi:hypothetical protein